MTKAYIHPSSIVEDGAQVGEDTKVWLYSHIMPNANVGENCQIGQNVYIGSKVKIGNGVKIQNNVSVYENVEIEDDVFLGPSMVFTNVINPRSFISRKHEFKDTLVKKGSTIGANATIVCGVTIGEYSFIGAGATVTKDISDFALVIGVPAKQVGWVCICAVQLEEKNEGFICPDCQKEYQRTTEGIKHVE